METFISLFGKLMVFVYHCFDRIVINGYLSMLSRPENVVYFFHQVVGEPVITKEVLAKRTADYQSWVEAFARNHRIPMQWAEKGLRKAKFIEPFLHRMKRRKLYDGYFIFQRMAYGASVRSRQPKFPAADPNYQNLSKTSIGCSLYYFYSRDELVGAL